MDTLTRNNYARLFKGPIQSIAYAPSGSQLAAIFDRTYMPALVIDPGKQIAHNFNMTQNTSQLIQMPQLHDDSKITYVAVQTNGRAKITWTDPTSRAVLMEATSSDADGVHNALWCHQGIVETLTISIPPTAQGGGNTEVKVFIYELPDLEVFTSYYDRQIGLGVTEQI